MTEFLVDLFAVADPSESKGESVTALELLERGTQKVERQLHDEPVVRARLLDTLGRVHQALGLSTKARLLLEEGLELRRSTFGPRHLEVADSLSSLATLLGETKDNAEAMSRYEEALSIRRELAGPEDLDSAVILVGLGMSSYGKGEFENAERLIRDGARDPGGCPGPRASVRRRFAW